MKRKQVNKLNNIPAKKIPKRRKNDFNIDDYIMEHVKSFEEAFSKKCKKEFMLLDILT